MNFEEMNSKQVADYCFGSNVFPQQMVELFEVGSTTLRDESEAKAFISNKRKIGFAVKSKRYSDFTSIFWAKKRN